MMQTIYWILVIIVMILLLINAIRSIKSDEDFRRYIRKQETRLDKQARDMFLKDLKEVSKMLKDIERKDK